MGIPFTYNRRYGAGAEILKLHGSSNWMRCSNEACSQSKKLFIAPLQFREIPLEPGFGTVEQQSPCCHFCGRAHIPLLVPPAWGKSIDHQILRDTWSRAAEVLFDSEVFVSIGYSLPIADAGVRDLLTVGFASGRLRQATIVTGNDPQAAERWSNLYRGSWRDARLEIRGETFEAFTRPLLFPALAIPDGKIDSSGVLLPIERSPCFHPEINEALEKVEKLSEWWTIVRDMRLGLPAQHESTKGFREAISRLGFDWIPDTPILPSHSTTFPSW
jgi:hypothetical protein